MASHEADVDEPGYERDPFEDWEPDTDAHEADRADREWAAKSPLARLVARARSRLYWRRYWRERRRHPERYPQDTEPPF